MATIAKELDLWDGDGLLTGFRANDASTVEIWFSGVKVYTITSTSFAPGVVTLVPAGTAAAPGLGVGVATLGLWEVSASYIGVAAAGASQMQFGTAGIFLRSGGNIGWSTTADPNATSDIVMRRSAAKTLTIDTDGVGGALTLIALQATAVAVSGEIQAPNIRANAGGAIYWASRAVMSSPADGIVQFVNVAGTGATRFIIGTNDATTNGVAIANQGGFVTMQKGDGSTYTGLLTNNRNIIAGGSSAGSVGCSEKVVKTYSAIANNVATATATVTIPNAAHAATVRVTIVGSLGAGGAIGAYEATGTISYDIAVARTAGVNAVGTFSAAYGSATTNVAGGATITITASGSSVSGAVGATNTFTINVTIARGSGSSTNHTALLQAEVINANASGITVS